MKLRSGFTLVEILVAVTLVAIAAAILVPSVGQSQDWLKVPAASRQVLSDMLRCQNYAITTQQTVWVYFIADNNGRTAYTGVTFPISATPTAPTYSQCIATSTGSYAGTFVPRGAGIATSQPQVADRLITQFGSGTSSTRAPGALADTQLKSVVLDSGGAGTPIASFGFDYTGQPIDASGGLLSNVKLAIANSAGTSPTYIYIHSVSGEITTDVK